MKFNNNKPRKPYSSNPKPPVNFKGTTVEVFRGDVNGAIRKLKKILEKADRQKELSKREYYEKPSVKRKRKKDQGTKRQKKLVNDMILKGEYMPTPTVGQKHLKGKREKRKAWMEKEKLRRFQKRRGK